MKNETVSVTPGGAPLILSQPHVGQNIPPDILNSLTAEARHIPDTDWYIDKLYDPIAKQLDATIVSARMSRYVIDLNRDPAGATLYPGQSVTELCPTTSFDGDPLYLPHKAPEAPEISRRRQLYLQPYHDALSAEIARLKERHGYVIVYDCHSIRSVIPRFFDGRLPTMNIGTNEGRSADAELTGEITETAKKSTYSSILDGRFKGGYITRHYGNPEQNVHAVQMELTQLDYMNETLPFVFDEGKAAALRPSLHAVLTTMLTWADSRYNRR